MYHLLINAQGQQLCMQSHYLIATRHIYTKVNALHISVLKTWQMEMGVDTLTMVATWYSAVDCTSVLQFCASLFIN
jgi:hypothetical protein